MSQKLFHSLSIALSLVLSTHGQDAVIPEHLRGTWLDLSNQSVEVNFESLDIVEVKTTDDADFIVAQDSLNDGSQCKECHVIRRLANTNLIKYLSQGCGPVDNPCEFIETEPTRVLVRRDPLESADNCPSFLPDWTKIMGAQYDLRQASKFSQELELYRDCYDETLPTTYLGCPTADSASGPHFSLQLGSCENGTTESLRSTFSCIGSYEVAPDQHCLVARDEREAVRYFKINQLGKWNFTLLEGPGHDCDQLSESIAEKIITVEPSLAYGYNAYPRMYERESHYWTMRPKDSRRVSLGFNPDFLHVTSSAGARVYQDGRLVQTFTEFYTLGGSSLGRIGVLRSVNGCEETFHCYDAYNMRSWTRNEPTTWRMVVSKPVPYSPGYEMCPFETVIEERDERTREHFDIPREDVLWDGFVTESTESELFVRDEEEDGGEVDARVDAIMERLEASSVAFMREVRDTVAELVGELKKAKGEL